MMSKLAIGAVALTTLAGGTAGVATVDAFEQGQQRKGGEARQEVRAAIEANDFDAWYSVVSSKESPLAAVATEDVFAKMVAIHELAESGDKDSAKEARETLRTELGLPDRAERPKRMHKILDQDARKTVHTAIADKDFDTWVSVLTQAGVPEDRLTEEHFDKMLERHEHRSEKRIAS